MAPGFAAIGIALGWMVACSGRVTPGGSGEGTTAAREAAAPLAFDAPEPGQQGLKVELFDPGAEGAGGPAADAATVAQGTALSQAAADAVLARVPALEGAEGDRTAFAFRPPSKRPPLPGSDTLEAFPPDDAKALVAVKPGPVELVRFSPEGEVPMAPNVSLTFNQPMVAVTSQDEAAKTVPAKLSPQPAGRWRWLGTKTLLFDPDPRLPMATEFTVEVPAGTRSAAGTTLAAGAKYTFATPPATLESTTPSGGPYGLTPVISLRFDQKVDPAKILDHLELAPTAKLRLATAEEVAADPLAKAMTAGAEPGRVVSVRAAEPLAKGTSYAVRVLAGAPSAEGPRLTTADQYGSFYTYGPLEIVRHHCWNQDPCPPQSDWTVELTNPLDPDRFDPSAFRVTPEVPGLSVRAYGQNVQISGAFVGRSVYTLVVPGSLTDRFGQTLGKDVSIEWRTGPADKTLESNGGTMVVADPAGGAKFAVWSTNHPELRVTIHAVRPEDHPAWLKWLNTLYYDDNRPKKLPGTLVHAGTVKPEAARDRKVETDIDLAPYCKDGTGQFVLLVEPTVQPRERWNRQYVYAWVQVTKLGLTAFVDGDQVIGWATELATGGSASGVSLSLLTGGGAGGTTAADGLAALGLPESSAADSPNVLVARRGSDVALLPEADQSWSGTGWIKRSQLDQLRWYVADDRGLYRPGEHARVKGWIRRYEPGPKGDIAPLNRGSSEGARGSASVAWRLIDALGAEIGKGTAPVSALGGFSLDLALPTDANLGSAQIELTANGIGDAGSLMTYHPLRLEEFRRPEFEVTASADADHHGLGERAEVELSAAYYAGGALPNADVSWVVYATGASYVPPGWAEYAFGKWSPWWESWDAPEYERPIGTMSAKTDGGGKARLGVHFVSTMPARPWSVRVEGTAMDVNRQAWTASSTMLVHPSGAYVGLKTDKSFVDPKTSFDVAVAVVDPDGKPLTVPVTVEYARMEWGPLGNGRGWGEQKVDTATEKPATCTVNPDKEGRGKCTFTPVRGGSYRMFATVTDAAGRTNETELRMWVTGGESVPARDVTLEKLTLVPEQKELSAGDTARILVQSPFAPAEAVMTVRRDGLVSTERFTMDSATRTVSVPVTDALVPGFTVQVDVVGTATRLGDDGKPRPDLQRRIAHASGAITFDVPPRSRTLTVKAVPGAEKVAPGAETTIAVDVTRADGSPVVGAEVAVVVADESVLALTGYRLPDPLPLFYAARGPGVSDYRLRDRVALADPNAVVAGGVEGGEVGGVLGGAPGAMADGDDFARDDDVTLELKEESRAAPMDAAAAPSAPMPAPRRMAAKAKMPMGSASAEPPPEPGPAIAVRTDLSALALFAPDVATDAKGHAIVPLKLPDSLTRYRIMVVAVDAGNGFGSADGAITARLPLMVRPSAPRFLNFGDQVELPVVVQNQTDAAIDVDVVARGTNVRFVDAIGAPGVLPDLPDVAVSSAGKRVTVPANDRVEVRFPAATLLSGTARFQVVAAAAAKGGAADASTFSLPVWTPATTEAFATYGSIDGPGVVQPVKAPPGSWPQFGGLEVTTSSTQLQALTDAVLYLQSYPFECNEQISSRVLAIASLRDVLTAFDAPGLPPAEALEAQVDDDLQRLAARQHWNGGFSFWRKGDETWPFLSIHVANAFARAKAKGYDVPADAWSRSLQHLRDIRSHIPYYYSPESRWFLEAYALDVRRRMGDADPGRAKALYAEASGPKGPHAGGLGIDGLALLLPTLQEGGATTEVTAILRYIGNNTTESAGTAHFVTSYSDGAYVLLHSDRRADGMVLEALMELPKTLRDDELVGKVVAGLLGHRTKGRWGNTQENAFVLLAMDRYFRTYEAATPDFVARVWLGEDYVGDHAFRGRTTERSHVEVPMGLLTEHGQDAVPLTVVRDGKAGRLYYRIGLKYAPKDLRLAPADYGFAVERSYEAIDAPSDVSRDPDGTWRIKAGARVRVKLAMATPMRRNHVALVDPLPAGLEAENPALATTGTLPSAPPDAQPRWWWWSRTWWEHENLRDDRVEAFTSLLWDGVYTYTYVARATTPGAYVVPPTKAEEMYAPETFGRSGTDRVVVR